MYTYSKYLVSITHNDRDVKQANSALRGETFSDVYQLITEIQDY